MKLSSLIGPLAAAMIAMSLPSPSPALDEPTKELPTSAKESFERGVKLFKEHDYMGALAEFLAAYEAKPHFSVLYNIAQCYAMTDNHAKAYKYYKQYMAEGIEYVPEERKEIVKKEIARLKDLLCPLTLVITPDGSQIVLDGKMIGESPIAEEQYLDPGDHTLTVQKDGHVSTTEEFVLRRDDKKTVKIALEKKPEPVVDELAPPPPVEVEPVPEKVEPEPEPKTQKELHPAGFWTTMGLTGALGVATIVTGSLTLKKSKEFSVLCEEDESWETVQNDGKNLTIATDVLIGLTAAAALTSVILGIVTLKTREPESRVALSPVVLGDGLGLAVGGRY